MQILIPSQVEAAKKKEVKRKTVVVKSKKPKQKNKQGVQGEINSVIKKMENMHINSYLNCPYAKALIHPWKAGEHQRVPYGGIPTSMIRRKFNFNETVLADTPVLFAFMPWFLSNGTYYNVIKTNTLTDSASSGKVTIPAGLYNIATTNYSDYRLVSASVTVSNITNVLNRGGLLYGNNIIAEGTGGDSTSAGIAPISTSILSGVWPSQCNGIAAFSQSSGCIKNTNPMNSITVRWYPIDEDCIALNPPSSVCGGKAISSTSSTFNACNLVFACDPGSTNQTLAFSVDFNYELVSTSTSITYGNDKQALPFVGAPLTVASFLYGAMKPYIVPSSNSCQVKALVGAPQPDIRLQLIQGALRSKPDSKFLHFKTGNRDVDKILDQEEGGEWTVPGYNYVGPGTHTLEKIIRNVKPADKLDEAALAHDIDYAIMQNDGDRVIADMEFKERAGINMVSSVAQAALAARDYISTHDHSKTYNDLALIVYDEAIKKLEASGYKKTPLQKEKLSVSNLARARKALPR